MSAAVVSMVPAVIAPTLTLTSGFSLSFTPLTGIVMNGMVKPSSTYDIHSQLILLKSACFSKLLYKFSKHTGVSHVI